MLQQCVGVVVLYAPKQPETILRASEQVNLNYEGVSVMQTSRPTFTLSFYDLKLPVGEILWFISVDKQNGQHKKI